MIKGWGAPEVESTFARAHALCQQVENISQHFQVMVGLWRFYLTQGAYHTAHDLAEQLLRLAESHHERSHLMTSYWALGTTMLFRGVFVDAHTCFEHCIALYDPRQYHSDALLSGTDSQASCLAYGSVILWLLGYPEQALHRSHEALNLAQELSHLPTLSHVLFVAGAVLQRHAREWQTAQDYLKTAMSLSSEHGLVLSLARQKAYYGWTLAMQGDGEEGIVQIRQGLESQSSTGSILGYPQMHALLAEAYGTIGQVKEGLAALAEAMAMVDNTGERWYEAELHRLKGQLLLQHSADNATEAETCFHQALDIARHQQAKSWELRAATSLARLWQRKVKRQDAYDLLAPVYGWFTEGFDTADLKDAKTLLDELA